MPKTFAEMKRRLEQAIIDAEEAEELLPLLREVIVRYEISAGDLFPAADPSRPRRRVLSVVQSNSPTE